MTMKDYAQAVTVKATLPKSYTWDFRANNRNTKILAGLGTIALLIIILIHHG